MAAAAPDWSYLAPGAAVIFSCLALEIVALAVTLAAAAGAGAWAAPPTWEAIVITLAVATVAVMALASPLSRRIITLLLFPLYYWAAGFAVPPSVLTRPGIAVSGRQGPLRLTLTTPPALALQCLALAALPRPAHHPKRPPAS